MQKVWAWIKKYWKWVLFPIGILGLVFSAAMAARWKPDPNPTPVPDPVPEALDELERAAAERKAKLEELERKHQARLEQLSIDQRAEYEALKDKPIEELTAWFDNL